VGVSSSEKNEVGRVVQISVNPKGGVPKHRIETTQVLAGGVAGDKQRNRRVHGGPERAVCLFSYECIRAMQDEGHPIDCGTTGENVTVSGLDWAQVKAGDRFQIGDVVQLEVTRYTTPCTNIADSFVDGEFMRISHKTHPGWSRVYARVLNEGTISEGDEVRWVSGATAENTPR
jgi:MOSC domain-containing protein YiiM